MIVRVRSKDGTFRLDIDPNADVAELGRKILENAPGIDPESLTISNQPRGGETLLSDLRGRTVLGLGLRHGDLIFASYSPLPVATLNGGTSHSTNGPSNDVASAASSIRPATRPWESVEEDPVDSYWRSRDGKIPRPRDAHFCKHGENAMCDYCMPLEPFDAKYHADHSIKHLSYHAYLRKLTAGLSASATASTMALPPLENLSYRVKIPCPSGSHASWPSGICSKCQPSAITLQSQPFRMVDHVEFSSSDLIERFLTAWRRTGVQRFGFLVGRYEPYEEVPMGIKTVVEAIHEPPQEGEVDGLTLGLPWDDEARIQTLAASCKGLQIVGVVYTDLTPDPDDKTKLLCKRHADSFFFSSLETIFAAQLQIQHPCPSRSAPSGSYSSRFVTCVLSGTAEGGIDVSCYQASEQGCAMVEADMIEASMDPGIVRVKEEKGDRYVPDVFYRFKNEYGLEVKQSAKPCFPVEYLLVNITHGFPTTENTMFRSSAFPIENRPGLDYQDLSRVTADLSRLNAKAVGTSQQARANLAKAQEVLTYLSDWHLLAYLGTVELFSPGDMKILASTATAPDWTSPNPLDQLLNTDGWRTLLAFVEEPNTNHLSVPVPSVGMDEDIVIPEDVDMPSDMTGTGSSSGTRPCPHCTFENPAGATDCAICGLPIEN